MRLIFLRHPETVANQQGIIYGKKDFPYTSEGERQMAAALLQSDRFHFDRIITSPLARAKGLAEEVAKRHSLSLEEASALEEMGYGIFEGLRVEEAKVRYPVEIEAFFNEEEAYEIPEGEGYDDFTVRVTSFLDRLMEGEGCILLVTHGGVVRTAIEYLLDHEPGFSWQMEIGNCSFVEMDCTEGVCRLINLINLRKH